MPDSQFGPAPTSLDAALGELVALARHLRETPASIPSRLSRLEGLTQILHYFTTPPIVSIDYDTQPPAARNCGCAFEGCTKLWSTQDACLINFARRGEPALWLCRDHHPPLTTDGGIRPPGWRPSLTESEATEAARKAALAKLTRAELRLVNSRMQGA